MEVFRIILVGTSGRLGVEPQAGKIQLLQTDFAGVKTHHRIFPDKIEKLLARFIAGPKFLPVSDRLKKGCLLLRLKRYKRFAPGLVDPHVQPTQAGAETTL